MNIERRGNDSEGLQQIVQKFLRIKFGGCCCMPLNLEELEEDEGEESTTVQSETKRME